MLIERLPAEAFQPDKNVIYKDAFELHALFDKIGFRSNLILVGPKGIAKTLSIAAWAAKKLCPVVTFDCSEDIRRSHLVGSFILRGDDSPYILGAIPTAIEIANEVGQCILCMEEINALTPAIQKMLNPVGDYRRKLEVPECKKVFKIEKKAKLWLCGTMNTDVYGGTYLLNEDLKSRFRILPLDYPHKQAEQGILQKVLTALKVQIEDDVIDRVLTLAHETRQRSMSYSLSTRDVVQILEDTAACDLKTALLLASGKFESEDHKNYKARVASIFGIAL